MKKENFQNLILTIAVGLVVLIMIVIKAVELNKENLVRNSFSEIHR